MQEIRMAIKFVDSSNFQKEVIDSDLPVMIDFYADWCGPCKMITPIIDRLAKDYKDRIKIFKLDVEKAPDIAKRYRVSSIPLVMFFKGGEKVDHFVGTRTKEEIMEYIEEYI